MTRRWRGDPGHIGDSKKIGTPVPDQDDQVGTRSPAMHLSPYLFARGDVLRVLSSVLLVTFSVSATISAHASRSGDGSYPYNTFVVPCVVEACKLFASVTMLTYESFGRGATSWSTCFENSDFLHYVLPAFCYFVSNNCTFYSIQFLGATKFQIMNNLKVLSTGVFMRILLQRKLSWSQWRALVILIVGSIIAQLEPSRNLGETYDPKPVAWQGYAFVGLGTITSGMGGVFSEKLLKNLHENASHISPSIHAQNTKLYMFGLLFGLISLKIRGVHMCDPIRAFDGFNIFAFVSILSLTLSGLTVSFVLKYVDSIMKCFCAACSMLLVASLESMMENEFISVQTVTGIVLTAFAMRAYSVHT